MKMRRSRNSRPSHSDPHDRKSAPALEAIPSPVGWLTARGAAWFRAKNPVLMFVLVFALLLALFYAATLTPLFKRTLFPGYLRVNAHVASTILNLMGQRTRVSDFQVSSGQFGVDIRRGCDAVEPTALYLAALLAFPAPLRRKLPGILAGVIVLALVNLVRIVSLFLVGLYWPQLFDIMHGEVWQAVFILLSVILWACWIRWAMKSQPAAVHVSG